MDACECVLCLLSPAPPPSHTSELPCTGHKGYTENPGQQVIQMPNQSPEGGVLGRIITPLSHGAMCPQGRCPASKLSN